MMISELDSILGYFLLKLEKFLSAPSGHIVTMTFIFFQNPERSSGGSGETDRQERGPLGHVDAERQEAGRDADALGSFATEPGRKTQGPGIRRRILSGGLYLSSFKSYACF